MIPLWSAIVGGIYLAGACTTFFVLLFFGKLGAGMGSAFGLPVDKHPTRDAILYGIFWFILFPIAILKK